MNEHNQRLHETLQELQAELEQTETLSPEVAAELQETLERMRTAAAKQERPVADEHEHRSVMDSLEDARDRFAAEPPNTSRIMTSLIEILDPMGIWEKLLRA